MLSTLTLSQPRHCWNGQDRALFLPPHPRKCRITNKALGPTPAAKADTIEHSILWTWGHVTKVLLCPWTTRHTDGAWQLSRQTQSFLLTPRHKLCYPQFVRLDVEEGGRGGGFRMAASLLLPWSLPCHCPHPSILPLPTAAMPLLCRNLPSSSVDRIVGRDQTESILYYTDLHTYVNSRYCCQREARTWVKRKLLNFKK